MSNYKLVVWLFSFGESIEDVGEKKPHFFISAATITEPPKLLRVVGGNREKHFQLVNGLTIDGHPVYKESDVEPSLQL